MVTDSVNHRVDYSYGPAGKLLSVIETDTGMKASYTYTPDGDLETATDSAGRTERYAYDSGHDEAPPDYVPEGQLDAACELACAPSFAACDAGGVCTGAPARGRSACLAGCVNLAFACSDACSQDCYHGEGRSTCRGACRSRCDSQVCNDFNARNACDEIWQSQNMEDYCDGCFDEILQGPCGSNCDTAFECLAQGGITIGTGGSGPPSPDYCTGGPGDNVDWCQSAEVWVDCAIEEGLDQTLADIGWFVASFSASVGESLWCVGTAIACSWNPWCDPDCDYNHAEEYWREMCNDTCNLCRAYGQLSECAGDSSCPPRGTCADECRTGFYLGYAESVAHCEFELGFQPPDTGGCIDRAKEGCMPPCTTGCANDCSQSCKIACTDACLAEAGVNGPDCWDACWEPENDDWYGMCEGSCGDSCKVAEREKGPFTGPKYGAPRDLNHNLLRVYDGNGALYVENIYGEDIALANFDRVIRQDYAGKAIRYAYQDLDLDVEVTTGEVLLEGGTDAYHSVDVCPGPCLDGPWPKAGPSLFFPWDGIVIALEGGGNQGIPCDHHPGGSGFTDDARPRGCRRRGAGDFGHPR